MIQEQLEAILYHDSYLTLFLLSFVYFFFLYFGIAPLFNAVCKQLHKHNILQKIVSRAISTNQFYAEIKHSLLSIIIFGFSIIPVIYLIRIGYVTLLPNTWLHVITGLLILNVWNEFHFFVVHRIMHLPFFMKNVHYVHHQSKVPTVYSVYSFHWLEAFLLSTVPITILPFLDFSFLAIAIYPLVSILINYSGHCNYRFGNGTGKAWQLFGTLHNQHHFQNKKNHGFVLQIFDHILAKLNSLTHK